MKIGRNTPCPCGSGKKYKKCCLLVDQKQLRQEQEKYLPPDLLKEIKSEIYRNARNERIWQQKFGEVRPIIHADFQGHKFVAVGDQLHYSKDIKTFPDFLLMYIKTLLGKEWGEEEIAKPYEERHQIIKWYQHACQFQKLQVRNEEGIFSSPPSRAFAAFLLLAYDLYILRHHSLLQQKLIARLKHKDQFQGSRYEIFAAATCCRAGFEIEYEDETDRTRKHPEFVGKHKNSGQTIAVEAKSRHRAGILGFRGNKSSFVEIKADIGRLLNQALKKSPSHPYVIFVDLNLPPLGVNPFESRWFSEIANTVRRIAGDPNQSPDLFNIIIFTNHPHHYGDELAPDPPKHGLAVISPNPQIPAEHPGVVLAIYDAALKYGNVPNSFSDNQE